MEAFVSRFGYLLLFAIGAIVGANADTLPSVTESQPNAFTWSYSISNNEPASSADFVYGFELAIQAKITSIQTPLGWDYQTDQYSYIYWFSTSTAAPYPDDLPPGVSLSGFVLSANALSGASESVILSWNHLTDELGTVSYGAVDAPVAELAPEPFSGALFMCGIGLILWCALARHTSY